MVINFSQQHSLISNWVAELRDVNVQGDRMRFRRNLERIAESIGYELSKKLPAKEVEVTTPLGTAKHWVLDGQPVLATILRAGLPMHQGLLNYFDKADSAFISAYRKHHPDGSFEISLEYLACPPLQDRVLIIADPMLATGASLAKTLQFLRQEGTPKEVHIVAAIACQVGIDAVLREEPTAKIWCGDIDEELTAKSYIVPGLGDAGDLAFGSKSQQ
ncbi:MAG: uracil phosphoribosyltransferase [Bacteroidota bacterium]|jgi:uracil phosphoribosyltransferase